MPKTIQEEYDELIRYAEKYIRSPHTTTSTAVFRWRNKALRWLKSNAQDCVMEFNLTKTPTANNYVRGITSTSISGVQKGLKILENAKTAIPLLKQTNLKKITSETMGKVFIVHGHDDEMKYSVANFVSKLNLKPVILHELANGGRTIIEKFLDSSDVGFAIVLLSGDDKGGKVSDVPKTYKLRARQNVIFELGFFIGKLNRNRVAALYKDNVEIPSDYSGVLFIPFREDNGWEFDLAKEMRAAGLKIDLNKL